MYITLNVYIIFVLCTLYKKNFNNCDIAMLADQKCYWTKVMTEIRGIRFNSNYKFIIVGGYYV